MVPVANIQMAQWLNYLVTNRFVHKIVLQNIQIGQNVQENVEEDFKLGKYLKLFSKHKEKAVVNLNLKEHAILHLVTAQARGIILVTAP